MLRRLLRQIGGPISKCARINGLPFGSILEFLPAKVLRTWKDQRKVVRILTDAQISNRF